ncbi:MAG: class I SAM-dependent methyltransferase [Chloroflexi bacterium]|nr:class I SAM-dependent methyltransferase [Chloroflexota bacterium]
MLNDPAYVREQYRASNNLTARIALHERFSTAPRDWFDWYFDRLDLPMNARVLEVGCGVGELWKHNRARIPATWQITLTDFSFGMIEQSRAANIATRLAQCDAQNLPFEFECFDAVIANHMLYHVPDIARALAQFKRVLRRGGKFYAATNGATHMREYFQLIAEFRATEPTFPQLTFTLENGAAQLAHAFADVRRFDFDDALSVTETEPLVAYALSGAISKALSERADALRDFIAARIARDGAIRIKKSSGLFVGAQVARRGVERLPHGFSKVT